MIKNPYIQLHQEFISAGARVLLSSGQACVMYGIAAFSKDGDWVIEETEASCSAVLSVLERKGAEYRLGAPLDVRWLSKGWTSRQFQKQFILLKKAWGKKACLLSAQHKQLLEIAFSLVS